MYARPNAAHINGTQTKAISMYGEFTYSMTTILRCLCDRGLLEHSGLHAGCCPLDSLLEHRVQV